MILRDVMTGEKHAVTERSGSQALQPGDLLFGQLASVDRLTMLEASNSFAIPPTEKAPIIELRARIASASPTIAHQILRKWDLELLELFHEIADRLFNPKLPVLLNTDGEPLSLYKLVFDLIVSPQDAFDTLKHLARDEPDDDLLADATRDAEDKLTSVRFSWKKRGNKMHAEWNNTVLGWIEIDGNTKRDQGGTQRERPLSRAGTTFRGAAASMPRTDRQTKGLSPFQGVSLLVYMDPSFARQIHQQSPPASETPPMQYTAMMMTDDTGNSALRNPP